MTTSTSAIPTNPTAASVANTSSSSSLANTAQAVGATGSQQLAGNFDTFLQLLTTQLQNQDPLDPLDTDQFTEQLVEFASVEQQVDMNTNLQTLISLQQTSEATSAMQFIGSSVTLGGNTATLSSSSPATWSISSPSPATGTVSVTNSSGQVAYTGTVSLNSGNNSFSWNGQGSNGVSWPAGTYTLSVNATGANGQPVTTTSQIQGVVSGVNLSQSPPQLIINGQSYPISAVQSINGGTGLSSLNSTMGTLNSSLTSSMGTLNSSLGSLNTSLNSLLQTL
jgi:flagellar basal-body rod modification protein FlgD